MGGMGKTGELLGNSFFLCLGLEGRCFGVVSLNVSIYIYIEIYVFKFTYRSRKELHKKRSKEKRKHPGKTPCKRISGFQQCFQEPTPVSRFGMMDTLILPTFEVYLLNLVPSHFPAYWLSRTIYDSYYV